MAACSVSEWVNVNTKELMTFGEKVNHGKKKKINTYNYDVSVLKYYDLLYKICY